MGTKDEMYIEELEEENKKLREAIIDMYANQMDDPMDRPEGYSVDELVDICKQSGKVLTMGYMQELKAEIVRLKAGNEDYKLPLIEVDANEPLIIFYKDKVSLEEVNSNKKDYLMSGILAKESDIGLNMKSSESEVNQVFQERNIPIDAHLSVWIYPKSMSYEEAEKAVIEILKDFNYAGRTYTTYSLHRRVNFLVKLKEEKSCDNCAVERFRANCSASMCDGENMNGWVKKEK